MVTIFCLLVYIFITMLLWIIGIKINLQAKRTSIFITFVIRCGNRFLEIWGAYYF